MVCISEGGIVEDVPAVSASGSQPGREGFGVSEGLQSGYATRYTENTITWCHWIGTTIQIRPELRFERAWDMKAYDYGRRQNQLTVAAILSSVFNSIFNSICNPISDCMFSACPCRKMDL